MPPHLPPPPRDEAELLSRARSLTGLSPERLSERLGVAIAGDAVRTKGKVGSLVEGALGATGGPRAAWDFPALRIELKTIPLDATGRPLESTFVCTVSLSDADSAEWATSWARAKLSHVLWIPIQAHPTRVAERFFAEPVLWSPSPEQEAQLADDFDEILGRVATGDIEALTGRVGRWLQLRPKAAHGAVRTLAPGADGALIATVPRGFYLRSWFTGALLRNPEALPEGRPVRVALPLRPRAL